MSYSMLIRAVLLPGALKAEIFPLTLYTSAGTVLLNVYDSTLHAKGQSPLQDIVPAADSLQMC